jgi:hypothetical protein
MSGAPDRVTWGDQMSIESTFDPSWLTATAGVFVSYGSGADVDMAFDDAALTDRFEYGTSGRVASLADADPSSVTATGSDPVHRHVAWRQALELAPTLEPGALLAIPVAPFRVYKHRVASVQVTDPDVPGPLEAGGLWLYPQLHEAAAAVAEPAENEVAVSSACPRVGSVRYKAAAVAIPGPKVPRFAVYVNSEPAPHSVHDKAPAARKAALEIARDKTRGPLEVHVLQVAGKADGEPLLRVTRTVVACRRPVRVLLASVKAPEKPIGVDGWLFVGRQQPR